MDLPLKIFSFVISLLFVGFLAIHLLRFRRAAAAKRAESFRRRRSEGSEDDFDPDFLVELAERRRQALEAAGGAAARPLRQVAPGEGEVVIYAARNDLEATLLCQALRSEGIHCRLRRGESLPRHRMADLDLLVPAIDAAAAQHVIGEYRRGAGGA